MTYKTGADRFGSHRVLEPRGALPQQADKLDPSLPLYENELLIEVESLNIDSSSFHQMKEVCGGDVQKLEAHILEIVRSRGKQQNPVTGSGGMLIGRVADIGPRFYENNLTSPKVVKGDRVATLVSLTLTPLVIRKIKKTFMDLDRVDIEGHAVLFQSGVFSVLPKDISDTLALAVLDVAGAPAHTDRICEKGQTVVIIGGAGKSGMLSAYAAKRKVGPSGKVICLDYSQAAVDQLQNLSFVDATGVCDARNAIEMHAKVAALTGGKLADIVINVTNVPNTEMSAILAAKQHGIVYFFSTATNFNKAALGAEGVGADVQLIIGNGFATGHAALALEILRESKEIRTLYSSKYGES